jgi:hypothetical protein
VFQLSANKWLISLPSTFTSTVNTGPQATLLPTWFCSNRHRHLNQTLWVVIGSVIDISSKSFKEFKSNTLASRIWHPSQLTMWTWQ